MAKGRGTRDEDEAFRSTLMHPSCEGRRSWCWFKEFCISSGRCSTRVCVTSYNWTGKPRVQVQHECLANYKATKRFRSITATARERLDPDIFARQQLPQDQSILECSDTSFILNHGEHHAQAALVDAAQIMCCLMSPPERPMGSTGLMIAFQRHCTCRREPQRPSSICGMLVAYAS